MKRIAAFFFAAALFFVSRSTAEAEPLHPAQDLGLSAVASAAKSLVQDGFDFKSFENKPVLGSLNDLVRSVRGPGAPGDAWGWDCRVRAEALATALDRSKLKNGKASGAYAPVSLFRTYRFSVKPLPAESAELKPIFDRLQAKAGERKDAAMSAAVAKLRATGDAAEFAGAVRGLSYYVGREYSRDWARLAEAVSAMKPVPKTPEGSPASLTLDVTGAETEKYLKLVDGWEPIEDARAVGFLAAGESAADEKESVDADDDGVSANDGGEEDDDENDM